jgi:hypothetical protein
MPGAAPSPQAPYGTPPPGLGDGFTAAMGDIADKSGLGHLKSLLSLEDGEFWKGALVGAAVVLLLTSEELRDSLIGGAAKTAEAMKSGLAGTGGGAPATNSDEGPAKGPTDDTNEETPR